MIKIICLISAFGLFVFNLGAQANKIDSNPELIVETGHTQRITSTVYSPDGQCLATAGWDRTVKIWDAASGSPLRTLSAHTKEISSLAFSPDGKILVSGGWDNKLNVWNLENGELLRTLIISGFSRIESVSIDPAGKILASADGSKIRLWDLASGTELQSLTNYSGTSNDSGFTSVIFSHDGKMLAAASFHEIKIWDLSGEAEKAILEGRAIGAPAAPPVITLAGHADRLTALQFSPDDRTLYSGSWDKTVKLWNTADGKNIRTIAGNFDFVLSVSLEAGGKLLAFSEKNNIRIWDLKKNEEIRSIKLDDTAAEISSIAWNHDGSKIAGGVKGSANYFVKNWDVRDGRELSSNAGENNRVTALAFSPDGKDLLVGKKDLQLWRFQSGEPRVLAKIHSNQYESVAFSPDGQTIATADNDSEINGFSLKIWNLSDDTKNLVFPAHTNSIRALTFSPDGQTLISRSWDKKLSFWNAATGARLRSVDLPVGRDSDRLVFSPDGKILATSEGDDDFHSIVFRNPSTGAKMKTLIAVKNFEFYDLAFSPDGKMLAGAGYHETKIWDVVSGAEIRVLKGQVNQVNAISFSPDGKLLAGGGADQKLKIWNVADGRLLQNLPGQTAEISTVAFRQDGRILAAGSGDGSVKLWDPETGKELATLISMSGDDWVVTTPEGFFDGTPGAWKRLHWRFNGKTFENGAVEIYFNDFFAPNLLQSVLDGNPPQPPAGNELAKKDRRQPLIEIVQAGGESNPLPGTAPGARPSAARLNTVMIEVTDNTSAARRPEHEPSAGARDLRLFRNGSLVRVWHGDVFALGKSEGCEQLAQEKEPLRVRCRAEIAISAGKNDLTAYAFNRVNVKSADAVASVNGADSLKRQGILYILAIGVNKYTNPAFNLKFAVPDVESISAEIKTAQEKVNQKNYAITKIVELSDEQAAKANITAALRKLAGGEPEPAGPVSPALDGLKRAEPEDAVIIYYAGHGLADHERFYLIPHDGIPAAFGGLPNSAADEQQRLLVQGKTVLDRAGLTQLFSRSFSDLELEELLETVNPGKLLMVIDACNSGQALESEEKRRGPMNSRGLAQLAYEKGMNILTASQSFQAALEANSLNHGLLTYALLEGLKKGDLNHNQAVEDREWLDYGVTQVPRLQTEVNDQRLLKQGKTPSPPESKADERQTPRVFYRREADAQPLVMAQP